MRKKYIILLFFSIVSCLQMFSQYNYIISSFDYSSNTTTYGRLNTLVKQPSYSPGISFYSKYNFDVSTLFYVLDNSDETYENSTIEFDIMAGYEWEPLKNLIVYPSYSHFFYSKNSSSFKSGFNDNIQLDIDYSIKFFNTGISGNYLFGEKNTGLFSFRNSILLEKEDFLLDNFYVAIQPGVDFIWGKQTYFDNRIEDYFQNNPDQLEVYLERLKDRRPRQYLAIQQYLINNPDADIYDALIMYYPEFLDVNDDFNLNAITLSLPTFFMVGSHFSFLFNMMYYKPMNSPDYIEDDWKFFWSAGISYTFNL